MKNIVYVAACALLVCTSCVTKKKYMIAENGRLEAVGRGDALKEELVNCTAFEHSQKDFRYWSNEFDMCTTFKTTHLIWVMRRMVGLR